MSVNAAFAIAFNPTANAFLRTLQHKDYVQPIDTHSKLNASDHSRPILRDVHDELEEYVRELSAANRELAASNCELQCEVDEMLEVFEYMQLHMESMEHQ